MKRTKTQHQNTHAHTSEGVVHRQSARERNPLQLTLRNARFPVVTKNTTQKNKLSTVSYYYSA